MIGTLRKLTGLFTRRRANLTKDTKEAGAYAAGQAVGKDASDAVEGYIRSRYNGIHQRYLDVFLHHLKECGLQTEHSPILVARIEYSLFRENAIKAKSMLVEEAVLATNDWLNLERAISVEGLRKTLAEKICDDLFLGLELEALKLLIDQADSLKEADNKWRIDFPELAAREEL